MFYFYCCCLNRVCHFIDNDLKKKIIKFLFLKGIYVHAYIVYTLQTIVCIKIRNH